MASDALQDGMLKHYLSQAPASDSNVEARLDREPFDCRDYYRRLEKWYPSSLSDARVALDKHIKIV